MTDITSIITTITAFISASRDIIIILIIFWGFKLLAKEIREGIKKAPEWLETYFRKQQEIVTIRKAVSLR